MNVNSKIISALTVVGVPTFPNSYTGTESTYITFNYADDRAIEFADNVPQTDSASIQVHLFAPATVNIESKIKLIRSQLFGADFTYPNVTRLYESDTTTNHIIFECETIGNSDI